MESEKPYNSHVVIPQTILNGFSHKTNYGDKIFIYDPTDDIWDEAKVKEFNTIPKYFSLKTEKKLSDEIENQIGTIRKELDEFRKNKLTNIKIDKSKIFKIFNIQILRNPVVAEKANEISVFSKIIGNASHDFLLNLAFESNSETFGINDFNANVILNYTKLGFVTTSLGFYEVKSNEKNIVIMPISDKVALVLAEPGSKLDEVHGRIINDKELLKFNKWAYYSKNGENFKIIGKKKDIKRLLQIVKI